MRKANQLSVVSGQRFRNVGAALCRDVELRIPPLPFPRHRRGFTLFELLVVIGLIAALSLVLLGGLGGGGKSAALQSAQAVLANLVSAARTKAQADGGGTRLLINIDPANTADPSRFLRYIAIQTQVAGVWQSATVVDIYLPEGV